MVGVFCFRNDLRLHDNQALREALSACDRLYLVYAFEERYWQASPPRLAIHRAKFLLESLKCLEEKILLLGGNLAYLFGNIENVLPKFMEDVGAEKCFISEENAWEEKNSEKALGQIIHLELAYNKTLIHNEDLPFDLVDLPQTFSKFRKLVEAKWHIRPDLRPPDSLNHTGKFSTELPSLKSFGFKNVSRKKSYFSFYGGTEQAHLRLQDWVWNKKNLSTYKESRNHLRGADFSSRFSPWIAHGCLSPREIYFEVKKYEMKHGENESTYWLIFELLWRDFFHFTARLYGSKIFHRLGIHPERPLRTEPDNAAELLSQWQEGQTQDRFINANMNELRETGWMSNRGRQNVASYLIHDLGLDWRKGAVWFEQQLIDYDPCCNYGNWLYLSGYGNDPQKSRSFNTAKQALLYDQDGSYTKDWA